VQYIDKKFSEMKSKLFIILLLIMVSSCKNNQVARLKEENNKLNEELNRKNSELILLQNSFPILF